MLTRCFIYGGRQENSVYMTTDRIWSVLHKAFHVKEDATIPGQNELSPVDFGSFNYFRREPKTLFPDSNPDFGVFCRKLYSKEKCDTVNCPL